MSGITIDLTTEEHHFLKQILKSLSRDFKRKIFVELERDEITRFDIIGTSDVEYSLYNKIVDLVIK